jgi:arylesterase / paraoxonase
LLARDATLRAVKKLMKPLAIGSGVLLLGIILFAADVARFAGVFHGATGGFNGTCSAVALAGSGADLQVDRERGLAYLSVLDRADAGPANGTVMLLDLNLAAPAARAALSYDPADFRPQGLSLLRRAGEPARLFVISRPANSGETVEIVEQSPGGAFVPKETIRNAAFVHAIAIAAVAPRQFYLATSGVDGVFPGIRDLAFRRGTATLLYYDGKDARIVERGLKYPAGLALSPDGSRLYVGEMLGKQLRIYSRDIGAGTLTPENSVALEAAPAALDVDAEGTVWIAAQPQLFALLSHLRNPAKAAPTLVLRFDPRDTRLTQVYGNDGSQIPAGSVAAHWHDEFLVGAHFEHKVLICKPAR